MTLSPSDVRMRSVCGSLVEREKTPVSRSPYSAENPPVVSEAVPSDWMSTIEKAPPTSRRWKGSTSSKPSSETYSSSPEPPRTLNLAEKSSAETPGSRATAR